MSRRGSTTTAPPPLAGRARAALARGHARRAVDLADVGLNHARLDSERAAFLQVRAAAELALGEVRAAHASSSRAVWLDGTAGEAGESVALVAAAAAALGRHEEAAAGYGRAVALDPGNAAWAAGHAAALMAIGDRRAAAGAAEASLTIDHGNVDARQVLGTLALREGRPRDAVAWLEAAAARAPQRADVRTVLGQALTAAGDVGAGMLHYQHRHRQPGWRPRRFDIPAWDGSPLRGERLLVWDEQGLGDTLQFARYAVGARARGARVVFHGEPRLCRLLRSCPAFDELVSRRAPRPPAALHAPLMSLPALLGEAAGANGAATGTVPYLQPEPAVVAHWVGRLGADSGARARLRVGLAWQGNPQFADDAQRSVPLAALHATLRALAPRARFVSLQKGYGREQLYDLPLEAAVDDLGTELDLGSDAFVDSAALISTLDLVITSDTALAHLTGALGRPLWLLLARVPDWRWGVEGESTPWYPSARLFRQPRAGDWAAVGAAIGVALAAKAASGARNVAS